MNHPSALFSRHPKPFRFAKTGGLADVAGALPKFLHPLGCDIRLVMPYYRMVKESGLPLQYLREEIEVPMGDETIRIRPGEAVGRATRRAARWSPRRRPERYAKARCA